MAFKPVDYYHLASWLNTQQNQYEEARYRAIISKAYYGAFLEARSKADIASTSASVHEQVSKYFQPRNASIANRLNDLRVLRNNADYDTVKTITSKESGRALSLAKKILNDVGVDLV